MRVYNIPHADYCGVDLHARTLFVHVLDDKGQTRHPPRLTDGKPASPCATRPGPPHRTWASARARTLSVSAHDQAGTIKRSGNMTAKPEPFLKAVGPFRPDLLVGCECVHP